MSSVIDMQGIFFVRELFMFSFYIHKIRKNAKNNDKNYGKERKGMTAGRIHTDLALEAKEKDEEENESESSQT